MSTAEEKQQLGSPALDRSGALESPLPPAILRGLGDRSYDKRKNAALDLTGLIKNYQENGEKERIASVINLLAQEFVRSRNANHRKGGLIGIAACAIGFMPDIQRYLHLLLPPVLECFDDQESRVCYYACESLYNIAKVARNSILRYFNQIFDGLCKLFAHVDVDVKNGANLLDRLIKDIVTESETFDIEGFIPLLQKHIKRTKPYIRQLLVGWISILNAVPDIHMLDYLPEFLDGLFNMLSDGNREIRQGADNVLGDFLREIKQTEVVEFGPMVNILVSQSRSKERFNRLTAVIWLHEFIGLGGTQLLAFYAPILGSIMFCISDQEQEIRKAAQDANQGLLSLVRTTAEEFELGPLLRTLTIELLSPQVTTRVAALSWINMLHEKDSTEMNKFIGDLLPALLKTLSDTADEVVLINLQVIARICIDEQQFLRVLNALVQLFFEDRPLLETRGALIIRKLCVLLDCQTIYISLASIMAKNDIEFCSTMVQTLNLILLTAPELSPLRNTLQQSFTDSTEAGIQVFMTLFKCWSHNPVATFSLCLLSQAYDLSADLIQKFAEVDVTVGFLMQIDKLVQLLESPIFIRLRLQLLEVSSDFHADLLKSLYGLLMLLPQSQAYKTLSDRLSTVGALKMHLSFPSGGSPNGSSAVTKANNTTPKTKGTIDYSELLVHFAQVQQQHSDFRLSVFQQKKLLRSTLDAASTEDTA
mmetsp:Transcript_24960/g.36819  ORF Transcript_24960/g.36819 Transcript_24960/m.36819 type:complete len:706 (-) Transcript_24960:121-2238(-)|eukprot:CAMPEP_0185028950 /NCGR_PEP_ID=MMETSP1103-20130426/15045_1 /TAXON_ID=36769 /ORGANISM="Paraphysomonas bandaiensis, Strain Caron Lab Isolate" /LENGTH=705 /DNA_ID=CAMNT_0027563541 /DNA_START=14 /DNA_END=2134 /DNA_ORIENTATION=-